MMLTAPTRAAWSGCVEQPLDLGQREVGELLGEGEDVAHLRVVERRERLQELVRRHGAGA